MLWGKRFSFCPSSSLERMGVIGFSSLSTKPFSIPLSREGAWKNARLGTRMSFLSPTFQKQNSTHLEPVGLSGSLLFLSY